MHEQQHIVEPHAQRRVQALTQRLGRLTPLLEHRGVVGWAARPPALPLQVGARLLAGVVVPLDTDRGTGALADGISLDAEDAEVHLGLVGFFLIVEVGSAQAELLAM